MIELRTLGALELLSAAGQPLGAVLAQPRRTALLCYMALASRRGFQRRDTLHALFWPEHDAEQARHALRQSLYFLRRALGATAIVSRGGGELAVAADRVRCDAVEFERAVEEGRLEAALALYGGDLLVGFHISKAPQFERWLDGERFRLRQRASAAAWALAEARKRAGDPTTAAEWGRRAADLAPADETVLRRLVCLLDRLGDRAAAIRAYEAFAWKLEREYELEPSDETRALLARIRAGSEERTGAAAPELPRESARTAAPAAATTSTRSTGRKRRTDWPRRAPRASAGLVVLLAVLWAGTWRLLPRAAPELAAAVPERVVVADFLNRTSDSVYGDLVDHVFLAELARSPLLAVVGPERIAGALQRMRATPGGRLTGDVAREVAVREGVKVVVEGDIRAAGDGFNFSAAVVDAASGDVIHGATETARDSTEVLAAIRRVSDGIRHGIGESLASIQMTDRLWRFTTSSLPALRKHMAAIEARGRGEYLTAVELLEEAIALDSAFSHAYVSLGGQLESAGLPRGRVIRPLVRAYESRDRLTERERYAVEGHYHLNVTGDVPKAVSALRKHIETLRQIGESGWISVFGATLELSGDLAAAERFLAEAPYRSNSAQVVRVRVLYALGSEAEARGVLEDLSRRAPGHPGALRLHVALLANSGRYQEAHALAARVRRNSGLRNDLEAQAMLDAIRGRLDEAVAHFRSLRDQALALGELAPALEIAAAAGRLRLLSGDAAGASEVDDLLGQHRLDSVEVLSRPYLPLALFYAEAGRPHQAQAWLAAYEREVPAEFRGPDRWMLHRARAAVHRMDGRPAEALAELRQATRVPAVRVGLFDEPSIPTSDHPELARTHEALGAADSAIAVYERYLSTRSLSRATADAFELATTLERLGLLYAARGDRARAAACYRRLAGLWRDADARLRPRAAAARRRADALYP